MLDFVDWIAKRCGGEIENDGGVSVESEKKSVLEVAQTISVIISLAERGDDQNVVTLSTLHAAKGLEWPHVVLAGVNEGLLPFVSGGSEGDAMTPERLEEERRLMYVGITRARSTLGVSVLRRRKRGREFIAGVPSRFIKEMKLDEVTAKEDPREKLKALARRRRGARAEGGRRRADALTRSRPALRRRAALFLAASGPGVCSSVTRPIAPGLVEVGLDRPAARHAWPPLWR